MRYDILDAIMEGIGCLLAFIMMVLAAALAITMAVLAVRLVGWLLF